MNRCCAGTRTCILLLPLAPTLVRSLGRASAFISLVRPLYHVIHLSNNYLGDHIHPHSVEFVSEVGVSGIGGPDDVEAIFP